MAKKGKFWTKLFKEKDQEEIAAEGKAEAKGEPEDQKKAPAEELKVEELPKDECRFCYNNFNSGQEVYKCGKCETYYHFPKCLKNQSSCRVCGDKIVEFGNIVKLIKFRSVVCPKCGMKIKLFYGTEPKLHISCPSCAHEGLLPNPYLKGKKSADESEVEEEAGEAVEGKEVEAEGEVEEEEKIDIELEPEPELEPEGKGEAKDAEGPKVIKKDKLKKRKAKLVVLEQSITCNVCLGTVKTGLPVVVCKCGKKYHESCAERVNECPTCDAGLRDYEKLIEEEPEISDEDLEAISKPGTEEVVEVEPEPEPKKELEPEIEPEPEPEPKPKVEFEVKLNKHNTFDDYTVNDNNRIVYSIADGIAKAPGLEFRLVYLYGSHGLGKTHLLHAIGNHLRNNNSKLKVRYTSISAFFSKLDTALEKDMKKEFEDYYNEADIFLLDDLHEIPKNKQTQDIFVKIFDNLLENDKQILVTGDRSIDEIKNLNKNLAKKLISRSGIIINLFESQLEGL